MNGGTLACTATYRRRWGPAVFCHEHVGTERFYADELLILVSLDHALYLPKHFQSTEDTAKATCGTCSAGPAHSERRPQSGRFLRLRRTQGVPWIVLAIVNDSGQQSPVPSAIQEHSLPFAPQILTRLYCRYVIIRRAGRRAWKGTC